MRIAWDCGFPVPQPFEMVNIEGRSGIVFERIYGELIMKRFIDRAIEQSKPQQQLNVFDEYIDSRITARLLYQIHTHSVPNMPSQRKNIKHDIRRAQLW
ncbi:hypothetical protein O9H85_32605 [Paenibacillus filicis]|uniref:Uncharacterized protein n=1 Tax=Paenibacillus gyeongsangnamensis TaxID=3388067 RepID=A0ABT4QJY9_9BACL|nr:hypothetical protein [Paenibacillus filicis]MCZ8517015.1 hypothetical protein [Paenibacillus filicis]